MTEVLAVSVLIPFLVQPAIPNPVTRPRAKMGAHVPMWTRPALHVTAKAALVVTHVKKLHVPIILARTAELVLSAKRMMARELLHVPVRQTSAEILAKLHLVARHRVKIPAHVKQNKAMMAKGHSYANVKHLSLVRRVSNKPVI